ncbi:MAG: glycosyltransferase [Labilithrix sp.]|nr:glycosyltransferase [Labilithrix sp.]
MKVLDVTEFYSERGGGVRSHLALKGHVLCQLGHDHVVVAPGSHDDEQPGGREGVPNERRLARAAGSARVIRVSGPASPYDPSYHLLLNTRKIRDLVARERPDVLEIHSPYMAAVGALRADPKTYGIRTFQWHSDFIDTYGGVLEDKLPRIPSPLVRTVTRPLWSLVRSIARRCDATLVASAWQVGKLTSHGVPNVVHRPFGIERDVFRPDARSFEARRELLALAGRDAADERTAVIVGVGRFAIEKRWDLVIDAFLRVRARGRDAVLVLFGDGPERERMKARARGEHEAGSPNAGAFADDVVLPGFSKDRAGLARSLASADALVHGCPFETFGLSIAEAMSCGLPAVVPDDGGAAEMHDPASGEQYPAGDAAACADALDRLLDRVATDGEAMRASAARAASRLPSVREQFEEQVALYAELLARRTSEPR